MKRIAKNNGRAAASSARAANSIMMAPNPIPQLSPETLGRYLDGWERGYLREPSLLFRAIETRDDRVLSVSEKRYKSISRYGYDVVIAEGHEDEPRAEEHVDAIRYCLDNLTATNAIKRDERGGFRTLVRQQCEAVGYAWSVHDIAWQPSREGITATFMQMPLYWFEHTTGQLRFLETDFQLYGRDLEPGAWMVTCGRGIHLATAIAYLFKRMSMMDWVIYCGRVGPGIHAKTSAQKDSPDWTSLEDAVANFGIDLKMVTADGVNINPIEMALKGTLPWPDMVKLMNMSIDVLWRGGNLSSEAGKDQSGVMIQGEEKDTLEQDDAEMCSDAINEYIVGPLIEQQFNEQPLAWVSVKTGAKPDQAGMLQVDSFLSAQGFPFTAQDMARRYERDLPEEGDEILRPLGSTQPATINPPPRPGAFANEKPDSALSPDAVRLIGDQVDIASAVLDEQARKILGGQREKMLAELEKAPTEESVLQILQDYINRMAGLVAEADLSKVDRAMETAMSIAIQDGAREIDLDSAFENEVDRLANEFDPSQTRDETGQWSESGSPSPSKKDLSAVRKKAFENLTLPLRKKSRFNDEVVFLDGDDQKVVRGYISGWGKADDESEITDLTGKKFIVKRDSLRTPKGGRRSREE